MYPVTKQYRDIMRAPVREAKAHATVYFGMFDRTAAPDATLTWSEPEDYAQPLNINTKKNITVSYATFEPDQLRLDGAQSLIPSNIALWQAQGFVSSVVAGAGGVFDPAPYIDVVFSELHSMVGLTLHFDEAYNTPAQFTVLSYRGGVLLDEQTVTEDIPAVFIREFLLEDVDRLIIRFDKAKKPGSRARLNRVEFGIGYTYADSDLWTLTEKHTGSPLSMTLPSSSLSFALYNEDGRFDVDGDTALQRFLAGGQRGVVDYGVDIGGAVETIPGGQWTLASWKVSGTRAEFKMENALAQLNKTTYEKSVFDGQQRSLYALAQAVLLDAGLTAAQYYIDPYLSSVLTRAPLPIGSHAVCLQLIANAGRCRLYVGRDGVITLERLISGLVPVSSSGTAQTPYSAAGTATESGNVTYATFEPSFMRLDGAQLLVPAGGGYEDAGWTALDASDGEGNYPPNELILTYDDPTNVFSVEIDWGLYPPPKKARLSCRVDGVWQNVTAIHPTETVESYAVSFRHCDAVRLELLEAAAPGQRARVRRVTASMMSDFILSKDQIYDNPGGSMETKLRNVVAEWTIFSADSTTSDIASADIETNSGWVQIPHDLCLTPSVTVDTAGVTVEEEHYAYVSYVRLTAAATETVKATLVGKKVATAQHTVTAYCNDDGEDLVLQNPLLASEDLAQEAADWTRDYYAGRVVYESNIRGFPELDNFDTVYLWDGGAAVINSIELTYNGAFNQKLKLRRR
jgi:hypothetical protein